MKRIAIDVARLRGISEPDAATPRLRASEASGLRVLKLDGKY